MATQNRFEFSEETLANHATLFNVVDAIYGEIEGAPGNVLDAARNNPHDHLAAFLAAEIVSACEAADCRTASDRRRAVADGLRNAAEILNKVADTL